MRGKILSCDAEFEEGGVGGAGLLANQEKLLLLSEFQGFVLHLWPHFGDISPCRRSRGWEGRAGGASSGCSPTALGAAASHRGDFALGAHPCPWPAGSGML